jgi:hypothetical protein
VTFTASGRVESGLCIDTFSLGTSRQISKFYTLSNSSLVIQENGVSDEMMTSIHNFGLFIFRSCDT